MEQRYDLLIIGAGPGGYIAAQKAARLGMSVLIVDKKEIGGTCVNRGCISTKALIHASMLYHEMKHCNEFGIFADHVEFDLQKIYEYKDHSAAAMREDLEEAFNALGTEVTVVEAADRLLPKMDPEFSEALEEILAQRGIQIYKSSVLESVKDRDGLCCIFIADGKQIKQNVDAVLISVGRTANTDGLFSNDLPIKMERGKIVVDEFFMTSIPGIYAIGDVIEGVQLAHVASAQASYVVERMNNIEPTFMQDMVPSGLFVSMSIVPSCVYTDPEIASVGLSEEEAKRHGVSVRCGKCVMNSNGQTIIRKEKIGFIKVVFAADSDVLLGAQMLCPRATDMIGELATAIANGLTSKQLMYAMRAHPTFNEAISEAVENSRGQRVNW